MGRACGCILPVTIKEVSSRKSLDIGLETGPSLGSLLTVAFGPRRAENGDGTLPSSKWVLEGPG